MTGAALYDVHGNLPALEAVLADPAFARADALVVGGDVASGPMPAEVLDRLAGVTVPVRWVRGNGDRLAVTAFDRGDTDPSAYPSEDAAAVADDLVRESFVEPVDVGWVARLFEDRAQGA